MDEEFLVLVKDIENNVLHRITNLVNQVNKLIKGRPV